MAGEDEDTIAAGTNTAVCGIMAITVLGIEGTIVRRDTGTIARAAFTAATIGPTPGTGIIALIAAPTTVRSITGVLPLESILGSKHPE